jgi:hypothetical protein
MKEAQKNKTSRHSLSRARRPFANGDPDSPAQGAAPRDCERGRGLPAPRRRRAQLHYAAPAVRGPAERESDGQGGECARAQMRARGAGREEGGGLPRGHGRRDAGRAGGFFLLARRRDQHPSPFAHASQELDALKGADSVYKMHGKVLIRQDLAEAKSTVNSRIKLIQTEMCVGGRVSPVCSRPPHTHTPTHPFPSFAARRLTGRSRRRRRSSRGCRGRSWSCSRSGRRRGRPREEEEEEGRLRSGKFFPGGVGWGGERKGGQHRALSLLLWSGRWGHVPLVKETRRRGQEGWGTGVGRWLGEGSLV